MGPELSPVRFSAGPMSVGVLRGETGGQYQDWTCSSISDGSNEGERGGSRLNESAIAKKKKRGRETQRGKKEEVKIGYFRN